MCEGVGVGGAEGVACVRVWVVLGVPQLLKQ